MDLKDARYVFRSKWVDLDIACSIFKNRKAILERSASESVDYQSIDQYGDQAMDQQELSLELNGASTTSDRLTVIIAGAFGSPRHGSPSRRIATRRRAAPSPARSTTGSPTSSVYFHAPSSESRL
ncbi:hypothetical protein FJ936_27060 [Mesorhizobium sp. B2-4-13]|uniref:portal protein n=1 Tax=Mesorhizobium sp. B2-4-13 TaxID=2589936 RepID=UPI00114EBD3F|nr:hypothetical protein [Mesorhizobium sp. B2-4-13]TPK81614.1 hypothetical protein FJ936_27060 [Mesorhizobium sp. B2-4-13]